MASVADYEALIPSANRQQPKFIAALDALLKPSVDNQNLLASMPSLLDVDMATGDALDMVGEWVNQPRRLNAEITGVYFALDTPGLGFDQGVWYNSTLPLTGIVELDDATYKQMIKVRIGANRWDGSMEAANAVLVNVFGSQGDPPVIWIVDNFDMSMHYGTTSPVPLIQQLVSQGYFPFKTAGVRLT